MLTLKVQIRNDEKSRLVRNYILKKIWEIVPRSGVPVRQCILIPRWLFNIKDNDNNLNDTLFKARLVIRGFEDNNDYQFQVIYTPVARYQSFT